MATAKANKSEAQQEEDSFQNKIEDYLTGPRRKRRNYVILGVSQGFNGIHKKIILATIGKLYPELAIAIPRNSDELTRQFSRNISLLILEDEFDKRDYLFELIKALKSKSPNKAIPVLFFTKNPKELITDYHRYLLPYQEVDDYIDSKSSSNSQIVTRIRNAVEYDQKRRSRRFQTDLEIRIFRLSKDDWTEGKLVDISMHGAVLESKESDVFREFEQIKLSIPSQKYSKSNDGDWFRLSAQVRRIFIAGTKVAVSFEYLTDKQYGMLCEFVTSVAHERFEQESRTLRLQDAKENQN